MAINQWDVWFAEFPYEDTSEVKERPVIVISVEPLEVLSIKVTSHAPRANDKYDIALSKWQEAGLKKPSTARVSQMSYLDPSKFKKLIGVLAMDDRIAIMGKIRERLEED